MLPSNVNYPKFQADQLLTSDNLNQLFGYLEEQGRLTRTNLIGMGIVCGLDVTTSADGKSITISNGCGITSEGYLISLKDTTYTFYKPYNAIKDRLYDRFVNSSGSQLYDLFELKQEATEEGTTALGTFDLTNKVVLLFVEILEERAKNCSPDSCDDKGVNVTVSFKPLLIDKTNADKLGNGASSNLYVNLPELKMRKVDVPATKLSTTNAIFQAYLKVISPAFLTQAEARLKDIYTAFAPLVIDLYADNPFAGLAESFGFLHDDDLETEQLISIQYFYDLFADVILAYEELRKTGLKVISECCSEEDSFPRHLLLGLAIAPATTGKLTYRNYFTPSPIIQGCCGAALPELRSLFTRLVLLLEKFTLTPQTVNEVKKRFYDTKLLKKKLPVVRITPSKYGEVPLSKKSIPYYYDVVDGPAALYTYWNYDKTFNNRQTNNLSYHASKYNTQDEYVTNPLLYDLEDYNFLRIEGHIGMQYDRALQAIQDIKNQYRLPFQAIALSGDVSVLRSQIRNLTKLNSASGLAESLNIDPDDATCQFQDLESLYDTLSAELICKLCMEMEYFYNLDGRELAKPASTTSQVPLLKDNDPDFTFTPNSFGHLFENYYRTIKNQEYISADVFIGTINTHVYGLQEIKEYTEKRLASTQTNDTTLGLAFLYYVEKLYESLTEDLSDFDIDVFDTRYDDFLRIANMVKDQVSGDLEDTLTPKPNSTTGANQVKVDDDTFRNEDMIDHFDDLIYMCKKTAFDALYKEYISRWISVLMLQRFGYFVTKHPGISHKAGVTMGGTFIIVYHEQPPAAASINNGDGGILSYENLDVLKATGKATKGIVQQMKEEGLPELGVKEMRSTKIAQRMQKMNMETEAPAAQAAPVPAPAAPAPSASGTANEYIGTTIANDPVKLAAQQEQIQLARTNIKGIYTGTMKVALDNLFTRADEGTQDLDDLIDDIDDGTVIADFYLPYLCYSDCPPVNFIINTTDPPEPPEEDISLTIDTKEFCAADDGIYRLAMSPTGGTLTGEGTSMDGGTFTPYGTQFAGGASKKDITITYTKGDKSATVTITVYAIPVASFDVKEISSTAPLTRQFTNTSVFADSFSWTIEDTTFITEDVLHTFKDQGTYTVTLTVTNGLCTSEPATQDVIIQLTPPSTEIKCMPLGGIYKDFLEFKKDDRIEMFKKMFQSWSDVDAYFAAIDKADIIGKAASTQIKFFTEFNIKKSTIDTLLPVWFRNLDGLIQSSDVSDMALGLYHIMADLTMYISCIQLEDTGQEKIDMGKALEVIKSTLPQYINMFLQQSGDSRSDILLSLRGDLINEKARIVQKDTPHYMEIIAELVNDYDKKM